ncbi:MAG TPA: bacterioferritin-associated ferredoxin [Candidatus Competibacteraceae bacterium]|nr:bacterioferritin-associated ferredoxin [Candidatus Competibacteraceae bacterium]
MYVCVCKAVTDRQIREAVRDGADSMRALRRELGVCSGCGKCAPYVRELLDETLAEAALTNPGYALSTLAVA